VVVVLAVLAEAITAQQVAQAAHRPQVIGQARPTTILAVVVAAVQRLVVLAQQVVRQAHQVRVRMRRHQHPQTQAVAAAVGKHATAKLPKMGRVAQAVQVR
jgi:hypothetical protein